jgi:hypothetical protein
MGKLFLILLQLCIVSQINAQEFIYNENCQNAYQAIFKLKIQEGRKLLDQEKLTNPSNLMPYFIGNYADFLSIYISENESLFKIYAKNKDIRMDKLVNGNKKSPYYLYTGRLTFAVGIYKD